MTVYRNFALVVFASMLSACAGNSDTEISSSITPAVAPTPNLDGRAGPDAQVASTALQPVPPTRPDQPVSLVPQNASLTTNPRLQAPATSAPELDTFPSLPPIPADAPGLRDGPECNFNLQVKNQEFLFSSETVALLRRTGARPWVFIRHDVDRGGRVLNPVVVRTAGIGAYDADAVRSVKRWQVTLPAGRTYLRGCMAKFAVR